jgi:UPF0716 family protein affecting phage T7 exclusion
MLIRRKIKAAVLAWLVAEVLALAVAVRLLGWPATLALGILTSLAGGYIIRRAGRDSMATLRRAMEAPSVTAIEIPSTGMLRFVSGLLLVIPGFVSDLLGVILLFPAMRALIAGKVAPSARSTTDGVVDLDPDQWQVAREQDRGASCEPVAGVLPGGPKTAASRRQDDE